MNSPVCGPKLNGMTRFLKVLAFAFLLCCAALRIPAPVAQAATSPVPSFELTALLNVYNSRPDLQAAFPEVANGVYTNLVNWAYGASTGQWVDSNYTTLAPYAYWYTLMYTYNQRPDLQSAFPNAYTSQASYQSLINWAYGVVTKQWTDGSYGTLAPFGYWYTLMGTYDNRPDLQSAFPGVYSNYVTSSYLGLINWAGGVVTNQWVDGSYSTLAPFGYWYTLMSLYNQRGDLQTAFPDALVSWSGYSSLVNWAGGVVTEQIVDSSHPLLNNYGYWYDLMMVYDIRPDLQAAFPNAYSSQTSYQNLINWAGDVVTQQFVDGAFADLNYYASYYEAYSTPAWSCASSTNMNSNPRLALNYGDATPNLWGISSASGSMQQCYDGGTLTETAALTSVVSPANTTIAGYPEIGYGVGESDRSFGKQTSLIPFPMTISTLLSSNLVVTMSYTTSATYPSHDTGFDLWVETGTDNGSQPTASGYEVFLSFQMSPTFICSPANGTLSASITVNGVSTPEKFRWCDYTDSNGTPGSSPPELQYNLPRGSQIYNGTVSINLSTFISAMQSAGQFDDSHNPTGSLTNYYLQGIEFGYEFYDDSPSPCTATSCTAIATGDAIFSFNLNSFVLSDSAGTVAIVP